MASTNKTANLDLNQWSLSDKPEMADFNADNLKIDTELSAHLADIVTDADGAHGLKVEKGTWSVTIAGETTQGVATYTTRNCSYVRIGDLVTCNFTIVATLTSATGNLILSGFPFLPKDFNNSGVVSFATVITSIKAFSNLSVKQNFRFINNNNAYVSTTEVVDKGSFQVTGQVTYEI